jgi:Icc-related predicted phosphoesterase
MKILSISDVISSPIYSPSVKQKFGDVDLVLDCGDTPYYYLEFVLTALNKPAFFVRGNHSKVMEYEGADARAYPHGAVDLHRRVINQNGLLLAGVQGSLRYHPGPFQYNQSEMWMNVFSLLPGVLRNRLVHGRFLDIFATHSPPSGVHDQPDLPHRGIKAFLWFIRVFQPAFHIHGHIHTYRPDTIMATQVGKTRVINTFGYRVTEVYLKGLS